MHEYGIAEELVSQVDCNVRAHCGVRAARVVVEISPGALDEQSLRTAFDMASRETTAAHAELTVEFVPLEGYCLECGSALHIDEVVEFRCPTCGSTTWRAMSPPGVALRSIEIEV